MKIKIIMMLKNEDDLAYTWIRYHGTLVGYDNLILLDNGSTSPVTLAALDWGRRQGAVVNTKFTTVQDFRTRSDLYAATIKLMDQHGYADFWFPMDCDEFLAVRADGRVHCDRAALERELADYVGSPHPLLIAAGFDNHPLRAGCFRWSEQRKTFFAAGACDYLDHGFHYGQSRQKLADLKTNIVYIHYHYKPFSVLVAHAKAKLAAYTDDFSREGLIRYGEEKKAGFHCVGYLLMTEQAYHAMFNNAEYVESGDVIEAFAGVGEKLPFA